MRIDILAGITLGIVSADAVSGELLVKEIPLAEARSVLSQNSIDLLNRHLGRELVLARIAEIDTAVLEGTVVSFDGSEFKADEPRQPKACVMKQVTYASTGKTIHVEACEWRGHDGKGNALTAHWVPARGVYNLSVQHGDNTTSHVSKLEGSRAATITRTRDEALAQ